MLKLYAILMTICALPLRALLRRRLKRGREDAARMGERRGEPGLARPPGALIWCHAASVGEALSLLSLIDALLRQTVATVLVTTGTVNSAKLMARRLPPRSQHQYYPLDRPAWVAAFLDHWRPDLALWTESEIWPNMLGQLQRRKIPVALLNACLSDKSFASWRRVPSSARHILRTFNVILAQTDEDAAHFNSLGAGRVIVTGNLKYSAAPLPADIDELAVLQQAIAGRRVWVYASTHAGEEAIATRLHHALKVKFPDLLTIIVPRHPDRRTEIAETCRGNGLTVRLRTDAHVPPQGGDDIYLADTLGELGLFYRLAPVACIGRSFSNDGGGGHNPLEAAQLGCAVLHGPNVANEAPIYDAMDAAGAALCLADEADFLRSLETLFTDPWALASLQEKGRAFVTDKAEVLPNVLAALKPLLAEAKIPCA